VRADGQRAGGEVRCACDDFGDGECVVHDALTYAEMESERDRIAGELYEAQMMIERLTVDDDARDGTRRVWLELEHWRTVIVPELIEQRDHLADTARKLTAERDTLKAFVNPAEHVRKMRQDSDRQRSEFIEKLMLEVVEERTRAEQAEADRDRLAAQVAQVMGMHQRIPYALEPGHFCGTCQETWPCGTVDALSDAGTDQTEDER
jgi:hypothetical protein